MSVAENRQTVEFVRNALTTHVRQVRDFCLAGCSRLEDAQGKKRADEFATFLSTATRLINNAEQMVVATRLMPRPNGINAEQLEAEIEQARDALHEVREKKMAA